ncbi:MAG TPA: ABC transporter ATP-binding protein [Thermotoga sp.]|nr:ABC transporter ATP-binding protein [Thermotoga sp.]
MLAVEVKDLSKSFGEIKAVRNISFEIKEGEIFGLIGPNGSGKTTTLRIVATLLKPDSGSVKIFGYDVQKNGEKIREMISYLPEDAGAYKNLSGKEYLEFIAKFFEKRGNPDEMVKKGIEIAKLGNRIKDKISTYSKGMIRRLLIARTFMVNPKLAILDEPTSGLDVINSIEVRNIIKDIARKGTTIFLSSHNMLEVEFLCDRIALINKGEIVEIGKPEELKNKYNAKNIEEVFVEVLRCSGIL